MRRLTKISAAFIALGLFYSLPATTLTASSVLVLICLGVYSDIFKKEDSGVMRLGDIVNVTEVLG